MPIIYDEHTKKYKVQIDSMITVEAAVAAFLDPFGGSKLQEFNKYENSISGLQEFLQFLYDSGEKELAEKGTKYHDWIMTAIEEGILRPHNGKFRGKALIDLFQNYLYYPEQSPKFVKLPPQTFPLLSKPSNPSKLILQEEAILEELSRLGFDPLNLPPNAPGKSGVKSKVRFNLKSNSLFSGPTVYKHAWDRLMDDCKIIYSSK
jgi:hypothetical protein